MSRNKRTEYWEADLPTIEALGEEVALLRAALEVYADEGLWFPSESGYHTVFCNAPQHGYELAQEALALPGEPTEADAEATAGEFEADSAIPRTVSDLADEQRRSNAATGMSQAEWEAERRVVKAAERWKEVCHATNPMYRARAETELELAVDALLALRSAEGAGGQ